MVIFACEKEQSNQAVTQAIQDNKFLPLAVGSWISYQVQDIVIDADVDVNDTTNYQIKELIESVSEQEDNYINYRLERYYRPRASEDWTLKDVWQIRQYQTGIRKVEENIEYLKIVTPLEEGDRWNGNAYNHLGENEYRVTLINDTLTTEGELKKATIVQADHYSLIDKRYAAETYLEGVGLIEKTDIDVELNIDPNQAWENKVVKGQIYRQVLIEVSK